MSWKKRRFYRSKQNKVLGKEVQDYKDICRLQFIKSDLSLSAAEAAF